MPAIVPRDRPWADVGYWVFKWTIYRCSRWSTWTVCPWVAWVPSVEPTGDHELRRQWRRPTHWAASRQRPWCVCPGRWQRRTGRAGATVLWVWTGAVDFGRTCAQPRVGRCKRCCRSPTGTWQARFGVRPPPPLQWLQPTGAMTRRPWLCFRSATRVFWGSCRTPPRRSGPVALQSKKISWLFLRPLRVVRERLVYAIVSTYARERLMNIIYRVQPTTLDVL